MSQVDPIGIPIVADTIPHLPLRDREPEDYLDEKNDSIHQSEHNTLHGRCLLKDSSEYTDVEWTLKEQHTAVRKVDFFLLPIFMVGFFFMALDRGNISGVLTSTIIKDTGITQDQINIGQSLLWLGVVLMEIPSNVILQRIGPSIWIPAQIMIWGLAQILTYLVSSPGGWYTARLFLGMLEAGFIPGSLYILSSWYTRDELTKRTALFFFGNILSSAFGSLISAGCVALHGKGGLSGWQWIFIVDGAATIATGVLAMLLLPSSPRHTAGGLRFRGWLSEREADILLARLDNDDPLKTHAEKVAISWRDIWNVLGNWRLYPHLIMCLSGLQAGQGAGAWSGTILQSLGISAINANLLLVPGPLFSGLVSIFLAHFGDKYDRRGYLILFAGVWILSGLIALYKLPILSGGNWGFYAAMVFTAAGPSWQPYNVTWAALNARTPAERSITYAVYIGCSNLGGVYGSQVFRASDRPLYRRAWAAVLSLGAIWVATTVLQLVQYTLSNRAKERKWAELTPEEQEAYKDQSSKEPISKRLDARYAL